MSLSSAISNALSGMRVSSAAAEVTGSNLANATNENHVRRTLAIQSSGVNSGGGVQIVGIERQSNPVATANWRAANGSASLAIQQADYRGAIQSLYGDPTQLGSLTNRITQFKSDLISAATRPDLTERLGQAAMSLSDVLDGINAIGQGIQNERMRADAEIAMTADRLNDILSGIDRLNKRVVDSEVQGMDPSPFLDQRDELLDELSGLTEVRAFPRERGAIAIYSAGGTVLLDGSAADITFNPTPMFTANQTVGNGDLSGLHVNGEPFSVGIDDGRLRGGKLGALFEYRDVTSVEDQAEIDAFAFEFATRLNDPAVDPTRTALDLGLATDQGAPIDISNIVGLSGRLALNATIDPYKNGNPTLLRDGLLATASGPSGNAQTLNDLAATLNAAETVSEGAFAGETMSLINLSDRLTNRVSYELNRSEQNRTYAVSQSEVLQTYKLDQAVDTDTELQNLMRIEQAYAANAQVLRAIDEMMDELLRAV